MTLLFISYLCKFSRMKSKPIITLLFQCQSFDLFKTTYGDLHFEKWMNEFMPQWRTFTPLIHSAILCIPLCDAFYLACWLSTSLHISQWSPFSIQSKQHRNHVTMNAITKQSQARKELAGTWPKLKAPIDF